MNEKELTKLVMQYYNANYEKNKRNKYKIAKCLSIQTHLSVSTIINLINK